MLELFLKLIERCVDLAKRREEVNKNFYVQFIAPAFADFEAVHKNYMDTFLRYRELLLDGSLSLKQNHPVIALIDRDSLFSDNLRTKVLDLLRLETDEAIQEFLLTISVYMGDAIINPLFVDVGHITARKRLILAACNIRYTFKKGLIEIFQRCVSEEVKRKRAINILDNLVANTQFNYAAVVQAHNNLKKKLLEPKKIKI